MTSETAAATILRQQESIRSLGIERDAYKRKADALDALLADYRELLNQLRKGSCGYCGKWDSHSAGCRLGELIATYGQRLEAVARAGGGQP